MVSPAQTNLACANGSSHSRLPLVLPGSTAGGLVAVWGLGSPLLGDYNPYIMWRGGSLGEPSISWHPDHLVISGPIHTFGAFIAKNLF